MNYSLQMRKILRTLSVGDSVEFEKTRPFTKIRTTLYYSAELLDIKIDSSIDRTRNVLVVERVA